MKCRPKGNRTPTVEEGRACAQHWLDEKLALVKPRAIVALGSVALKYLMGPEGRITRDRGRWFETKYGVPAIATYHPAYLLRLTGQNVVKAKWEVFYDLKAAVEKCKELAPGYEQSVAAKPALRRCTRAGGRRGGRTGRVSRNR